MKKTSLFIITIFIVSMINAAGIKPLINKNGLYVPFSEETDIVEGYKPSANCPKGSINYYRSCLGYGEGEIIIHFTVDCSVIALIRL